MGLLAQEIKELRRMVKMFEKGDISINHVETMMKLYKETHKRSKLILDALIACNRPHLIESRLHDSNVLSKGEFVQSENDVEIEMIVCPDKNDVAITRRDCLDFSGKETNAEKCNNCQHFKITRDLILGKK